MLQYLFKYEYLIKQDKMKVQNIFGVRAMVTSHNTSYTILMRSAALDKILSYKGFAENESDNR